MCLSVCAVTKRLIGSACRLEWSVSGVGRGTGVFDGSGDHRRELGAVLNVNLGHPIATNGILCLRGGDATLPKLFWDFLLLLAASL